MTKADKSLRHNLGYEIQKVRRTSSSTKHGHCFIKLMVFYS